MYLQRKNPRSVEIIRSYKKSIAYFKNRLNEERTSPSVLNPKFHVVVVVDLFAKLDTHTYWLGETVDMPAKKKYDGVWKGFVDVNLTSKEKEDFVAWDVDGDDLWLVYQQAIMDGHKFTLSWNKQNETFVAAFTGGEAAKENAGYTLSAFGKNWYDAVRVLCFKHEVILGLDWTNASTRTTDTIG